MKFKFVSTRVCGTPDIRNGHLVLSADEYLWYSSPDEYSVPDLFLDQFCCAFEVSDEITTEHYQPKGITSFLPLNNGFIPCAIAIDEAVYDTFIDISGFVPAPCYDEWQNNLYLLGYDVATFFTLSAFWHGISPYSENCEELLNHFGLFNDIAEGLKWVQLNNDGIPEHAPWYLVALFVSKETKELLETLEPTSLPTSSSTTPSP